MMSSSGGHVEVRVFVVKFVAINSGEVEVTGSQNGAEVGGSLRMAYVLVQRRRSNSKIRRTDVIASVRRILLLLRRRWTRT